MAGPLRTHEDPHSNVPSIRTRCSMLLLPVLQLLADVFQRLHRNAAVAEQVRPVPTVRPWPTVG